MRADALVASSRAAGCPLASSARRARRPRASSRVVARSGKDLAPPPSRAENARVAVDASRHGARVDTVRVVDASTIVVFGATVAVTSVAVTTAAIASTRVSPLLASLRTLSESAAAATRAAERASLEVEELAKMTSATLPVTLEAMIDLPDKQLLKMKKALERWRDEDSEGGCLAVLARIARIEGNSETEAGLWADAHARHPSASHAAGWADCLRHQGKEAEASALEAEALAALL